MWSLLKLESRANQVKNLIFVEISFPENTFLIDENAEVALFEVSKDDRFIILASDGVWEFLSNEEVSKIRTVSLKILKIWE